VPIDDVYEDLRRLAEAYFRRQDPGHTLQPTALVHEAWLRLAQGPAIADREHFLAVAATAMRQILVDHARRRGAAKRGGDASRITLDDAVSPAPAPALDLLDLDAALTMLARLDPRKARVVELRFFAGLTLAEVAAVLHVSAVTIGTDWRMARAWLSRELGSAVA